MTLNVNAHVQNWFAHNLNGAPDLSCYYNIWYFHIFCGDDAKRASFVKWLLCSEWLASCAACFRHISQTREIQLNIQRNAIEYSEKYNCIFREIQLNIQRNGIEYSEIYN